MLQELPLSDEERAAVDGDVQALNRLLEQLKDVPVPSNTHSRTAQRPFIPVSAISSTQKTMKAGGTRNDEVKESQI